MKWPKSDAESIRGRLALEQNGSAFLAPGRIDLLEAIGKLGSISSAAKAVGMSYKAAWDAVDAMNNRAAAALVARSVGGSKGGGTRLTDYGKRVVELVRRIEREYASVLSSLADPSSELAEYSRLQQQLSLRTSARNQWIGRVTQVVLDVVRAEVHVMLGSECVRVYVSGSSVERLGIEPGVELCMLVKATAVSLELREDDAAAVVGVAHSEADADINRLSAVVDKTVPGTERVEITARLPDERTVTAVMQLDSHTQGLGKGSRVWARFAPEQVILVQLSGGALPL